jgi:hypothetical protein
LYAADGGAPGVADLGRSIPLSSSPPWAPTRRRERIPDNGFRQKAAARLQLKPARELLSTRLAP